MNIRTFTIDATVSNNKGTMVVDLDHTTKKAKEGDTMESFEERDIAKKANEVSEFNRIEQETIKSMGAGKYTIEYKQVV